jgi:aspartyl-tRNA(Asn)/glutamyl-tRNA(Gln) amidotransferase subunit A
MTELTTLSIAQARAALAKRDFTATELADAHLSAMERARVLNAYVAETPERARAMAKVVRHARSRAFRSRSRIFFARPAW